MQLAFQVQLCPDLEFLEWLFQNLSRILWLEKDPGSSVHLEKSIFWQEKRKLCFRLSSKKEVLAQT